MLYEIKISKNNEITTITLSKKVNGISDSKNYVKDKCDELRNQVKHLTHFKNSIVSYDGRGAKTSSNDYEIPEAYFEKGKGNRESFVGYKTMNTQPNIWFETQTIQFKNFKTIRPVNTVLDYWNYTLNPDDKESVLNIIQGSGVWIKTIG